MTMRDDLTRLRDDLERAHARHEREKRDLIDERDWLRSVVTSLANKQGPDDEI